MSKWTAADIPSQAGRIALVTGANSGLGYASSVELARHGAHVIMTARDASRGNAALAQLKSDVRGADVELQLLDLADLGDVRRFATQLRAQGRRLDLLINNAGVMMPPRGLTKQGFELQIGVNHLGHFALTLQLLDLLQGQKDARVVTVSSGAHKTGAIAFDDLQSERSYSASGAYSQSKIANVYFALELQRRLHAAGSAIKSVLAHPGIAATNLASSLPQGVLKSAMAFAVPLVAPSPARGALSLLFAATAAGVEGGQYFGPDGWMEMRGNPVEVQPIALAKDADIAKRLWEVSERLTGVSLAATLDPIFA